MTTQAIRVELGDATDAQLRAVLAEYEECRERCIRHGSVFHAWDEPIEAVRAELRRRGAS